MTPPHAGRHEVAAAVLEAHLRHEAHHGTHVVLLFFLIAPPPRRHRSVSACDPVSRQALLGFAGGDWRWEGHGLNGLRVEGSP